MKEKNETKKADETEKTEQKETKNLEDKKDFETQEKIKEIIDSKNRENAGHTAPARGLFLNDVIY